MRPATCTQVKRPFFLFVLVFKALRRLYSFHFQVSEVAHLLPEEVLVDVAELALEHRVVRDVLRVQVLQLPSVFQDHRAP